MVWQRKLIIQLVSFKTTSKEGKGKDKFRPRTGHEGPEED